MVSVVDVPDPGGCPDENPGCDDCRLHDVFERAFILVHASVLMGIAGLGLIYDAYRKL
ncbi:MAG: hypothetical protein ACRD2W_19350 [Acidimicrobiales bacterium]